MPGLRETFANLLEFVTATIQQLPRESEWLVMLIETVEELAAQALLFLREELGSPDQAWETWLLAQVNQGIAWLQQATRDMAPQDHAARRLVIVLELAATIARGILVDQVSTRGFSPLDSEDLTEWLQRHGASPLTLSSALVRGIYQAAFAYPQGDTSRPGQLAAGTALRGFLRFLNYKGAPLYRMNAGMGDVVFAPLYQVLRRRGVRFRYFHRVTRLHLTPDRRRIGRVDLVREARLKTPHGEYEPLVDVKGLPCWPSEPLSEQLTEGEDSLTLHVGRDFDWVVLGIPIAALPELCGDLIAHSPAWRRMTERVATVPTLALQLWLQPDLAGLGWDYPGRLVGCYAEPFDTWMEMSHLLDRENWPAAGPGSIAYFCGPAPETATPDQVKAAATAWLEQHAAHLWPGTVPPGGAGFDWDQLVDTQGRSGRERLNAQYWRANTDPSERYVLSLPGSTEHRLRAGESGFANLVLAGDWVRTGLDAGCIEAAVMAGMQASRAISGYPSKVVGEADLP